MVKKEPSPENHPISKRLDAIIALLVEENERELGDNIVTLSNAGLKSLEIATILGKSDSYIRSELSRKRKQGGSKKDGKR